MPSHFVFVDDTGDPSPAKGCSELFGFGILEVPVNKYAMIRQILAEERWRHRLYRDFEIAPTSQPCRNVLTQLAELAQAGLVCMSGFYLNKDQYAGRYLTWCDIGSAPRWQWPHRLRAYVLRKALEFHYDGRPIDDRSIDLVLDRIALSHRQRQNLEDYLTSQKGIVLNEPFHLPKIDYITISDSSYTGGLQLAHIMTDIVKRCAAGTLPADVPLLLQCFRVVEFTGHVESQE